MLRRIFLIFKRDLKVNLTDSLTLYIILFPLIFAIAINIFVPSANEITVKLGFLDSEPKARIEYYKQFAKVETFKDLDELKKRISKRDDLMGIVKSEGEEIIMTQGNETETTVNYARLLKSFEDLDLSTEDTNTTLEDLGRIAPPLKKLLVNNMILLMAILGGMIIAINIVEEKVDNTISAINLTPIKRSEFIFGKSLMGIVVTILGSIILILITGFYNINILQLVLLLIVSSIISILLGFIQGIMNTDIMMAAGNMKLLFLPMIAGVVPIEVLSEKWQKFFYWNPFYWAYKGNKEILDSNAEWKNILIYTLIVFAISAIFYILLMPKIRKGLEK
ncbi:MAG: ABC transporter permease [Tissierellia bacterium]|nr:ABC transporter permease [Tissierellia bacterium]